MGEEVVAFHVGDREVEAALLDEVAQRVGESGRVEAAGVGDELDAPFGDELEVVADLLEERGGESLGGILLLRSGEDEHRQFGQVVAGEVVELAAFEHLAHGGGPVTVEPGHVSDPNRCPRLLGHAGLPSLVVEPFVLCAVHHNRTPKEKKQARLTVFNRSFSFKCGRRHKSRAGSHVARKEGQRNAPAHHRNH